MSDNFAYDFVSVIVGCDISNENAIFNNYLRFENKYKEKFTVDELKSEIIKQNQIKHGFAGLNKLTVSLLTGYFEFMVENNIYLYYSTFNKIEYVINQLFSNYHNSPLFDTDSLRYSITKILVMYEPLDVYEAIYKNDGSLVYELKKFIQQRIAANQGIQHKQIETSAFQQALLLLDDYRIGDIRIRLSVTISKLLDMDVAKLISEMYTNRNDFMHAGRRYRDDKDKLNKLENICFALFMKCLDLDTIIPNNSSRLKSWEDYLDAIFEIHIFGSVV